MHCSLIAAKVPSHVHLIIAMLTYASAQAMPPKKQAKKRQRQRQTTLFCSAEDSGADEGCSSEQVDINDAEDRPIAPLAGPAGSDSEATRLSPSL